VKKILVLLVLAIVLAQIGLAVVPSVREGPITASPSWLRVNRADDGVQTAADFGEVRTLSSENTGFAPARLYRPSLDRRYYSELGTVSTNPYRGYSTYYRQYLKERIRTVYGWKPAESKL
jgi:hypothetical protein